MRKPGGLGTPLSKKDQATLDKAMASNSSIIQFAAVLGIRNGTKPHTPDGWKVTVKKKKKKKNARPKNKKV